ncbi:MAG: hypothetical protein Kow0098_09730 [Ignavibacteriaceae bacterium]
MKQIIILIIAATLFIGCGGKSDKDYLDEASALIQEGKFTQAVSVYEELIAEHPESALLPEAMVGMAGLYQNQKIKNLSKGESLKKAADIFRSVYEKYPDHKQAPLSLFMSGFILANELKLYNLATETYKLFLNKYPDHELASSAKEELENMGLSAEEILKRKLAAEK